MGPTISLVAASAPPAPTATGNNPCEGSTITLFANTVTGATYDWNGPGGFTSPLQNPTRPSSTPAMSGTYSVTVTVSGCTSPAGTVNVTVNPVPVATAPADNSVCDGASVPGSTLSSTPSGATFTWTNNNPSIGLVASGGGNIPAFTANNNGASPITATISITPTLNGCPGVPVSYTITVNPKVTPTFTAVAPFCEGSPAPSLPATSNNGISGTWGPATIDNTNSGTYTFTPNAGQCAKPTTLSVTVNMKVTPTFNAIPAFCEGTAAPSLPNTSTNGYTGTWLPSTINNTASGTYTFTPNAGQCANTTSLNVTVTPKTDPTFNAITPFCEGTTAPSLPNTSTNGYTGTWSPSTINNTANGTYTFTPNAGQCANTTTLDVTVIQKITPTFDAIPPFCSGSAAPVLPTTSNNGYTGTWSPAVSNTNNGTYTFTPNAGQCANITTLDITVNPKPTATLSGTATICSGTTTDITISLTGTAPWTLTYNDGSGPTTVTANSSPFVLTTGISGTYTVTAVSDANCTGTASGTAVVTVVPPLIVGSIVATCNPAKTFYTVSFEISGGDPASYTVSGGGGTISSGPPYIFTSNPIPAASMNYSFTVTDANNCNPQTVAGTQNCTCPATAVMSGGGAVCAGSTIPVSIDLTGVAPWSFTYSDGTTSFPISGVNSSPYIINAGVGGNYTITTMSDANCIGSASGSATVTVNPKPTATISGGGTICAGSTTAVNIDLTGSAPWSITYFDGSASTTITGINSSPYVITANAAGSYTVTAVSDANCTGTSGGSAIVTVNPIPTATVSGGGAICAGSTAAVNIDLTGTAPWTITYDDGSGPVTVTTGSSPYVITANAAGNYTVTAVSDANCTGTAGGSAIVTIIPLPTATVSGGGTICAGSTIPVNIALTGTAPWTITYNDGITSTTVTTSSSPYVITANGAATYTVTAIADANCTGTSGGSAVVTVNPKPTATISGGGTICAGQNIDVNIDLTGTAPWMITYNNGGASTTVTANSSPYVISANAAGTFTVTAVSDANCAGTFSGSAVVTINPKPTATISGSATICSGTTTDITISLTGTAPWTLTYNDGSGPTTVTANSSPFVITAGVSGTYTVTAVSDANCIGTFSGTAIVTVVPPLIVGSIVATCNPAKTFYTVSFEISGGDPGSYVVSGGAGTISSGPPYIFTSNPIPAASMSYSFTVTDANNCNPQTVAGTQNCTCPATATISGGGAVCAGSTIPVSIALTGDAPWSFTYSDGTTSFPISGVNSSPYIINAGVTGTYTISTMSDVNCVGSAGGSATVTVNPKPTATVSGGGTICAGSTTAVNIDLTGSAPWSITYFDGSASTTITGINSSPFVITANIAGSYTVTAVSDANCTGTSGGSAIVSVLTPIVVSNITATCNLSNSAYTVRFEISGGDQSSYIVTGGGGTISASAPYIFTSNPILAASPDYSFTISDANNCSPQFVTGSQNCSCPATAILSGGGTICNGATTPLSVDFMGTAPWSFTYTDGTTSFPVTGVISSPYIINAGLTGTYSITSMADATCNGSSGGNALVVVNAIPTATVSGGGAICAGATTNVNIALTGTAPWTVTYNDGSGPTTVTVNNSPFVITAGGAGNYTVTAISDANCTGTSSGNAAVTMNATPTATISGGGAICAGQSVNVNIVLTGTAPWTITYYDGTTATTVTANSSPYIITATATANYTVTAVSDANCTGTFSGNATVMLNSLPTATISGGGAICSGSSTSVNIDLTGIGPWSVTYNDGSTSTSVTTSSSPYVITANAAATYTVTSVTDANCSGTSTGSAIVSVTPLPSATVSGGGAICAGQSINVNIALTGTAPWTITYNDGTTATTVTANSSPYVINANASGTYTVTNLTDANCIGTSSGSAAVILIAPIATATATPSSCSGTDGSIILSGNGGIAPYTYSIDNGATYQSSTTFNGLVPATYNGLRVRDANGCTATASATVILNNTIFLSIGPDTTICVGQTVMFTPVTNPQTNVFLWSPATYLDSAAVKNASATPPSTITYTLTAQWGLCSIADNITVNVIEKPVADAGNDTIICLNGTAILRGSVSGNAGPVSYLWSPATGVKDSTKAVTTASPAVTTRYTLKVTDLTGCGFTATDDVLVSVQPPVRAFAGNDTNAVKGQPHQLMGSGGVQYLWSPTAPLNNPAIQNPLATLYADTKFTLIVRDVAGCVGFDTVFIKVYDGPQYYVPNVFSPNGDGLNDVFRPIPVGMVNTQWFRVYNRWGELVFETNQWLKGWDGTYKGKKQPIDVYVWVVKGTDKNGKPIDGKGTVTLIE